MTDIFLPYSKGHTRACFAQHVGLWAVSPSWLRLVTSGGYMERYKAAAGEDPAPQVPPRVVGGIAILHIQGLIAKHQGKFADTSSVTLRGDVRTAAMDDSIKGIFLVVDSPGGMVSGLNDLSKEVSAAAAIKPVFAHVSDLSASGAVWATSGATRIIATEASQIGSIGTVGIIEDSSAKFEKEGIKVHVISTGEFKGAGEEGVPITDAHLADFQAQAETMNEFFQRAVQTGRGLSDTQMAAVSDGRMFIASEAQRLGLIDGIGSINETFQALLDETQSTRDIASRDRASARVRVAKAKHV